jgi:hypothetical protein
MQDKQITCSALVVDELTGSIMMINPLHAQRIRIPEPFTAVSHASAANWVLSTGL